MQDSAIPEKFTVPFGYDAAPSYIRTVPVASQIGVQNGAASFTDGFPPSCFLPIGAGGSWPFGQDFTGLLFAVTSWLRWMQAGAPLTFDAAFSTGVGGYPKSAFVQSASSPGLFWQSLIDNNTTDPDSVGQTTWVSFSRGFSQKRDFISPGTFTAPYSGVVKLTGYGAGGGGGYGNYGGGGGGAAGGFFEGYFPVSVGDALVITPGAAGVGGSSSLAGAAGGATTIVRNGVTLMTCTGGGPGGAGSANGLGAAGTTPGLGSGPGASGSTAGAYGSSGANGIATSQQITGGQGGGTGLYEGGLQQVNGQGTNEAGNNGQIASGGAGGVGVGNGGAGGGGIVSIEF